MLTRVFFLLIWSVQAFALTLPRQAAVPGGIIQIELGTSHQPAPRVVYQKRRVLVLKSDGQWLALVGIPLKVKAGQQQLDIHYSDGHREMRPFQVENKEYPAQYITVKNKQHVNPNSANQSRIKRERAPIGQALATWSEQAVSDLDFELPVEGRLSSRFGLRRFFNKQPRNPHSGLDIAAPTGTPIRAPAAGRVLNTGDYFFNGNSLFLDHGQGLITGYFHMHSIKAKAGDQLRQGDLIGTVGATGRVTGPHLHWNVYLNRTKVDPELFIDASRLKQ